MFRRSLVVLALLAVAAALPADAGASPQWLSAFDFTAGGGAALEQHAAFDAQGDAFAIWRRREGAAGDFIVQVASRPPGGPVTVQDVSAPGQSAYEPDLAVNANGDAVAAWLRSDGAKQRIEAAIRPAGGSFGATQTLSPAGQNARGAKVAIDSQGDAMVVWERADDAPLTGSTVQAAIRPSGGAFGPAKDLSVPANGIYAGWADVAVNAGGDAVAVWNRGPFPSPKTIQASFRAPGGDFGAAQSVTDPAVVTGRNPQVAVQDNGAALLEWAQAPVGSNQDVLQIATRAPGGLFGGAQPISRPAEDANTNHLAVNRHGDAAVIWESIVPGGLLRIEATRRPAGGDFAPVQDVSSTDGTPQLARVAVDDAGDALATWRRTVNAKQVIVGASAEAGGPFGVETPLSRADQNANNPAVAVSPRGDGIAVWEEYVGPDDIVQAAGFDRTGPVLSGLTVPGSATAGQLASFAVAARDVWSPVSQVTWDFGDGSNGTGAGLQHAFAAPGAFSAKVTATDSAGNATTSDATTVAVGAPGAVPPPTLSRVTLRSRRFLVAARTGRATRRAPSRGTAFRYTLSERATVSILLQRRLSGRRAGRRCVAPTRRLVRAGAKKCVRFVRAGRLVHASHAGRNGLPFSGRVGRRALRPGPYRAVLQADAGGGRRSRPVRVSFVVLG